MGGYRYAWIAWAAFAVVAAAIGVSAVLRPLTTPPTLQERVIAIAADVRCPECVGESAADSNTQAAMAIRAEIAKDLQAGRSTRQILDALAAEYGQWILYRPPVRGAFLILWGAPVLGLGAAGWLLRGALASRAPAPEGGADPSEAGGRPPAEADADMLRQLARRL